MADPNDPNKTTGDKLVAVAEQMKEEVTGAIKHAHDDGVAEGREDGHRPTPVQSMPAVTEGDVWDISRKVFGQEISGHQLNCLKPGGPLHDVIDEVKKIAKDVHDAFLEQAEQRGGRKTWAIVRTVSVPIMIAVAGWTINHFAAKHSDEVVRKMTETNEHVAHQLKIVQEAAKGWTEVDVRDMDNGAKPSRANEAP